MSLVRKADAVVPADIFHDDTHVQSEANLSGSSCRRGTRFP
jgi:hypothetical protein